MDTNATVPPVPPDANGQQTDSVPVKPIITKGVVILGALSLLSVFVMTVVIMKGTQLNYNSRASLHPTPFITPFVEHPTPQVTVTPGPINSREELLKALEEVNEESSKAAAIIQSHINDLDRSSF